MINDDFIFWPNRQIGCFESTKQIDLMTIFKFVLCAAFILNFMVLNHFQSTDSQIFPDFHRILRTPARHIWIYDGAEYCQLADLRKCGPFDPNPHLELLTMPIELDWIKNRTHNFNADTKYWDEQMFPAYRQVFEWSKEVNENLTVESEKEHHYEMESKVKFLDLKTNL